MINYNLDWLISTQGAFFEKFGLKSADLKREYNSWRVEAGDDIWGYLKYLLNKIALNNVKDANTELEYYQNNLEIIHKKLEFLKLTNETGKEFLIEQLHINELMVSYFTLPFKFDVRVKYNNCCNHCKKMSGRHCSLESVIKKKYLPHVQCTSDSGCNCSYEIVPLNGLNGNLIETDTKN